MSSYKILFGISGSISAYKALTAVSALVRAGHQVQCVGTNSSLQFLGAATIEGLTGKPFLTSQFTPGHMMDHIHLARWADVFVIAPASANTIARFANGFADDLLSSLYLAAERSLPILLAPAMNPQMWRSEAVTENVSRLEKRGVKILNPGSGRMACGEVGDGRLIEPTELELAILETLDRPRTNRGRVLITSGGTTEPIDSVRSITNTSTGRTGATLADALTDLGFEVHLVKSKSAVKPSDSKIQITEYIRFKELESILQHELQNVDYLSVVHAAAVSDYHVSSVQIGEDILDISKGTSKSLKLSSGQDISIRISPNPKLIARFKEWSINQDIVVIGFKLTDEEDEKNQVKKVIELFENSPSDLIVQNDLRDIKSDQHSYRVFDKNLNVKPAMTTKDLARQIGEFL